MSTPLEYYNSIPPVTKAYAVTCLLFTAAAHLDLYYVWNISLSYSAVFKQFQVWRLLTNFFYLGGFSFDFAIRIITILRYGAQLERGPYDKRTGDLLWMYIVGAISLLGISAVPYFWSPFMGSSMIYVILYNWGREFPNNRIDVYGLFETKGFYLPWLLLLVDMMFGHVLMPGLVGIAAGHFYYFFTVLYPRSSGNNYLKTPLWVYKLVAYWGKGYQRNSPNRYDTQRTAFVGRSNRLNNSGWNIFRRRNTDDQQNNDTAAPTNNSAAGGVAFRGRGRRLDS